MAFLNRNTKDDFYGDLALNFRFPRKILAFTEYPPYAGRGQQHGKLDHEATATQRRRGVSMLRVFRPLRQWWQAVEWRLA